VVAVASTAACGFDPASVPVPGSTVSGSTYPVHIHLANAMSLPARAKVVSGGALVGTLRRVDIVEPAQDRAGYVDADVDIKRSVTLPVNTTARLRQNTILGDIYIELAVPPASTGPTIPPGGVIPLAQTRPALQIEDLLAGMATFVNGGALHHMQDIVNRVNTVLPAETAASAKISDVLGDDARDLAGHLDSLDAFVSAIQDDIGAAQDNRAALDELLTEQGDTQLTNNMKSLVGAIGVVGSLGVIAHAIAWLAPLAQTGDAAAKAFLPLMLADDPLALSAPSNLNRLVSLLLNKVVPYFAHGPKVSVTQVGTVGQDQRVTAAGDAQVGRLVTTLRMIGAVR
jgi:virulence factor Mce-like protein